MNNDLKEKVIKILNQVKDEPCWMDWGIIYNELAELCDIKDYKPKIYPKNIMLKNCEHFIDCIEKETKYVIPDIIEVLKDVYSHLTLPFPEEEVIEKAEIIKKLKETIKFYEPDFQI